MYIDRVLTNHSREANPRFYECNCRVHSCCGLARSIYSYTYIRCWIREGVRVVCRRVVGNARCSSRYVPWCVCGCAVEVQHSERRWGGSSRHRCNLQRLAACPTQGPIGILEPTSNHVKWVHTEIQARFMKQEYGVFESITQASVPARSSSNDGVLLWRNKNTSSSNAQTQVLIEPTITTLSEFTQKFKHGPCNASTLVY